MYRILCIFHTCLASISSRMASSCSFCCMSCSGVGCCCCIRLPLPLGLDPLNDGVEFAVTEMMGVGIASARPFAVAATSITEITDS